MHKLAEQIQTWARKYDKTYKSTVLEEEEMAHVKKTLKVLGKPSEGESGAKVELNLGDEADGGTMQAVKAKVVKARSPEKGKRGPDKAER